MSEQRQLPCICPNCDEELDWSQTQTQSSFGPHGEQTATWTWDTVHCPKCGFVETTNSKMDFN
jgi:hypothetical protein